MKQQKPLSPHIVAFENYLHLITQMYYKKNFNLNESISNFEGTIKEGLIKITKKIIIFIIKIIIFFILASRPGRKAKNKAIIAEENGGIGNLEEKNSIETIKPDVSSLTKDLELINYNQDILNSLVSPLRKDFVFGCFLNIFLLMKFVN